LKNYQLFPPPAEFLEGIEETPSLPPVGEDDDLIGDDLNGDDLDGDGVFNESDECSDTVPGTPVNSSGCAMFNGALEGVNFLTGSDTLTDTARSILDDVVSTLDAFPDVRVSVQAHTDNQGLEAANLTLSRNRAHLIDLKLALLEKLSRLPTTIHAPADC